MNNRISKEQLLLSTLLFLLLSWSGCSEGTNNKYVGPIRVQVLSSESQGYLDVKCDTLSLVNKTDDYFVGGFKEMKIYNNNFFIVNFQDNYEAINVYNKNGVLQEVISNPGMGPGEFYIINSFCVQGSKIFVAAKNDFIIYDRELKRWDSFGWNYYIHDMEPLNEKEVLMYGGNLNRIDIGHSVFVFDITTYEVKEKFLAQNPVASRYMQIKDSHNITPLIDGTFRLFGSALDTIYTFYPKTQKMKSYMILDKGRAQISKDFLTREYVDIADFMGMVHNSNFIYPVNGYFETDKEMVFFYNHAGELNNLFYNKLTGILSKFRGVEFPNIVQDLNYENWFHASDNKSFYRYQSLEYGTDAFVIAYTFMD